MASCPNGHDNPDGNRYCGQCGALLSRSDPGGAGSASPASAPRSHLTLAEKIAAEHRDSDSHLTFAETIAAERGSQPTALARLMARSRPFRWTLGPEPVSITHERAEPSKFSGPRTVHAEPLRRHDSGFGETNRRGTPAVRAVRVVSHAIVWSAVMVPTAILLGRGWEPLWDDALMSLRSYLVLTSHSPLVGQLTGAKGIRVFQPGPLMSWLLMVPVRLDPSQGALWGSALLCGLALSLTVEALWSRYGWLGSAAVAFTIGVLVWHTPAVFARLPWGQFFGLLFLVASAGLACVVVAGRFGWWPALVFTASVAAQSHVFLAILAVTLVVAAPTIGILIWGWHPRLRWLVGGFAVGLACWSAPLIQQVSGRDGNIAALLNGQGAHRALGLTFGLRNLAAAGSPSPIWLHDAPTGFFGVASFQVDGSPAYGVFVTCLLLAVAAFAVRTRRHSLAAISMLAGVCAVALVASFAAVPETEVDNMGLLFFVLWVFGVLFWIVVTWGVLEAAWAGARRARTRDPSGRRRVVLGRKHLDLVQTAFVWPVAAIIAVVVVGAVGLSGIGSGGRLAVDHAAVTQAGRLAASIERLVPRGPVEVDFRKFRRARITAGGYGEVLTALYWLEVDGWSPGLTDVLGAEATGLWADRHALWPAVKIGSDGATRTSTIRIR
jgi:hypothetical protein